MKQVLNQLSKKYHHNGENVDTEIVSLLDKLTITENSDSRLLGLPTDNSNHEILSMLSNMTLNPTITQNIFQQAEDRNCLTEQIYTARIKTNPSLGLSLIEKMLSEKIQPHHRTFVAAFHSGVNISEFIKLLNKTGTIPDVELFSLLFLTSDTSLKKEIVEWAGYHCHYLYVTGNVTIDNGVCSCGTKLKSIDITSVDKDEILARIRPYDKFQMYRTIRMYDMVIDGANVAFYNNTTFNQYKVISLVDSLIGKLGNIKILIVFSICRQKLTKKLIGKWPNVELYYTQARMNDDLCWLSTSIAQNIWCISNDKIRDHIFHTLKVPKNVSDIWTERHLVTYSYERGNDGGFNHGDWKFNWPLPWSVRPQVSEGNDNGTYHIPTPDKKWFCSAQTN